MKVTIRIATVQYCYLEIEGTEDDIPKMIEYHNLYGETELVPREQGEWKIIETFTGEKVRYNDFTHTYTDMDGNKLLSGSAYKKRLEKPFPKETIIPKVAKKYGIDDKDVDAVWTSNANVSTTWGDAVHGAIEHYFKHKTHSCDEKEYHIANPLFLRKIVMEFPDLDKNILPEVMVSDVNSGMVGQIDALNIIDMNKKICRIGDHKTDVELDEKKRESYFNQLSFYAHILIKKGWTVEGLDIYHLDNDEWKVYSSDVLPLIKK